MNPVVKWIGGASAGVVMLLGAAVLAGQALEAQGENPDSWLAADDVLGASDTQVAAAGTPAMASIAVVQPLPEPSPEPESPFVIKRILPIDGPIKYGQWFWDEEGVPDGPLVITVDLDARVLSVFRGGYEIGAAAVLLGTDEYPTPLGTFPILAKERHNVSEKYGGAPMPWTLRLTPDGVAIHGGHAILNGYASHGCISSPDAFVSKLFAIAGKGDKVIITRGKTAALGDALIG
jgi:hypothetical protein